MKTRILNLKSRKDIDRFKRAVTEERLNILKLIRHKKPTSIIDLSRKLDRDYRNVYKDVKLLEKIKLLKLKEKDGANVPIVEYEMLKIEIPI